MSCAAQAIADSKEIARMKERFRLRISTDDKDESGQDGITISPRDSLLRFGRRHSRVTCNQTRSAAEGNKLNPPLDKDYDPALKFHNVDKVDEKPDQPRDQPRKM